MNWKSLYFGPVQRSEVMSAISDPDWQSLRREMKGMSLEEKHRNLRTWLNSNNRSRKAQVQVTNYVTALSRGGLITPKDYLDVMK